jgi:oligopeptide transport system substrate-binding protein
MSLKRQSGQVPAKSRKFGANPIFLVTLLLGVIAIALLWDPEQDESTAQVLNRGVAPEPESLDMQKARTKQAGNVQRDLGEGLVGYLENGEMIGTGAHRWELSEDGLVYTFFLRPESRWSNGDKLTAEDFVYSLRRLVDPDTAAFYASQLIDVQHAEEILGGSRPVEDLGVTATGEYELQIRLRRAVPYFLGLLTHPTAYPVHRATVEQHGDAMTRAENWVGNGAYVLHKRVPGSLFELIRNPYYRDNDNTEIGVVRFHVVTEDMAELARYRAGELDITATVPPDAFAQMRAERPHELRVAPYLGIYYYGFNLTKAPFMDNPKLRQALSMAIDREELVENVIGRGEAPAYSWVPDGVINYEPRTFSFANMSRDERHKAAQRLYRDAGFSAENPLSVEVRFNTNDLHSRIALAIQGMWRDVLGFEATLVNEEFQVFLANMRDAQVTQIFKSAWLGDYNDAYTFLSLLETDNSQNMFGYSNEKYDDLMRRAADQTDVGRRQLYLEEAEREALADHPVIPIYFYVSKHMISPRVAGWGDNILDYHYSQYLNISE